MSIYIPEKIKVGYQNRDDTYTKKLAYVIYYDEKGKLRKETSWQNWRDEKIDTDDFNNEPTRGFVLNKKVGGDRYGWNPRQTYTRVYDPRGFEFEITIPNLLFILEHCDCLKGKGLDGEFVYGWDGKELVLIPVDSPDYKEIKSLTDKIQSGKKFKGSDLIIGATYLTKNEEQWVYMGRFDKWTIKNSHHWNCYGGWNPLIDNTWTISSDDSNHAYKITNSGKYYWFYHIGEWYERDIFQKRKNIGDILIECIDEKPSQKYSEYFQQMEANDLTYNPVDYNSKEWANLPYDKFVERLKLETYYDHFYTNENEQVRIDIKDDGTYEYNQKKYLPTELYELIKPIYRIYKRFDGTIYHDYSDKIYYYF